MSGICTVCLEESSGTNPHEACVRALFDSTRVPTIDLDIAKLHTAALAMVGRLSLSEIQRKVSLGFDSARATLQVAAEAGRYILKPQAGTFPHLPENEHVTMRLAQLWAIPMQRDTWNTIAAHIVRAQGYREAVSITPSKTDMSIFPPLIRNTAGPSGR